MTLQRWNLSVPGPGPIAKPRDEQDRFSPTMQLIIETHIVDRYLWHFESLLVEIPKPWVGCSLGIVKPYEATSPCWFWAARIESLFVLGICRSPIAHGRIQSRRR